MLGEHPPCCAHASLWCSKFPLGQLSSGHRPRSMQAVKGGFDALRELAGPCLQLIIIHPAPRFHSWLLCGQAPR